MEECTFGIAEIKTKENRSYAEHEIEIVMNALAGYLTVTTVAFANKVEKILREHEKSNFYENMSNK